ncbi:MAG: DUF2283 domain-containing protein [bacterium]
MKITYDAEIDALYIQLRPINPGEATNQELAEGITADFGPDGLLSGIEILDASRICGKEREKVIVELTPIVK